MADLASIAQSGLDPITGSYLSSERRKAIFARSRVSSSVFTGGGALVPIQKTASDITQSLTLDAIQQNKVTLDSISAQLTGLRVQITDLNLGLNSIAAAISADSSFEAIRSQQEVEYQRKLAERQIRIGKENELEQRIQASLSKPVQAVAQRFTSIFDRVKQALLYLFLGWLTNQGIETLKAFSKGNISKLIEIRNSTLKNLAAIGGILLAVKYGINGLIKGVVGLTAKIAKFVVGGLIIKPFKAITTGLGNAVQGIFGLKKPPLKSAEGAAKGVGEGVTKGSMVGGEKGFFSGLKGLKGLRGIGGPLNIIFGGAEFLSRKSEGQTNLQAGAGAVGSVAGAEALAAGGAYGGAALGAFGGPLAPITVPAGALIGGVGGGIAGWFLGGKTSDILTGADNKSNVKPVAPKTNSLKMKPNQDKENTSPTSEEKPNLSPVSAAEMQSPAPQIPNVGPEPSPAPNIIMLPQTANRQQTIASSPSGESLTDVPLIPSSNPDNFYVMYSQLNYNVVI